MKTKRGRIVKQFAQQKWQSKQVVGHRKNCADRKRSTNDKENKLCVYGSFDSLNKISNFNIKKIRKEHSIDKEYFKEVYVLSDFGRVKLKRMLRKNISDNVIS